LKDLYLKILKKHFQNFELSLLSSKDRGKNIKQDGHGGLCLWITGMGSRDGRPIQAKVSENLSQETN
jgi:hypothetical protein